MSYYLKIFDGSILSQALVKSKRLALISDFYSGADPDFVPDPGQHKFHVHFCRLP